MRKATHNGGYDMVWTSNLIKELKYLPAIKFTRNNEKWQMFKITIVITGSYNIVKAHNIVTTTNRVSYQNKNDYQNIAF